MSAKDSSKAATGTSCKEKATGREATGFATVGLEGGSDEATELSSDRESFWLQCMTVGWVAARVVSAGTGLVKISAPGPAEGDPGKGQSVELDAGAIEPNSDGVPRETVLATSATSTAAKRSVLR